MTLDLDKTEQDLNRVAAENGIDLFSLFAAAGVHLAGKCLKPAPMPTEAQLNQLVADEMKLDW